MLRVATLLPAIAIAIAAGASQLAAQSPTGVWTLIEVDGMPTPRSFVAGDGRRTDVLDGTLTVQDAGTGSLVIRTRIDRSRILADPDTVVRLDSIAWEERRGGVTIIVQPSAERRAAGDKGSRVPATVNDDRMRVRIWLYDAASGGRQRNLVFRREP